MTQTDIEHAVESAASAESAKARFHPFNILSTSRFCCWTAILAIAAMVLIVGWRAADVGLDVRQKVWTGTVPIRFNGDISAGFDNGTAVLREAERQAGLPPGQIDPPGPGLFDTPLSPSQFVGRLRYRIHVYKKLMDGWVGFYDRKVREVPDENYEVDYPPMRLAVMALWAWRVQADNPKIHEWNSGLGEMAWPILNLNTACSATAAIAMFFLVWLWINRDGRTSVKAQKSVIDRFGDPWLLAPAALLGIYVVLDRIAGIEAPFPLGGWTKNVIKFVAVVSAAHFLPRFLRGPVCGLIAAILVWLNPAMILDSHVWPQWDCWLLPFFLVSALLASLDAWLLAGLVAGVGSMFKGQVLLVIPLLVLWPLFAGRPGRCAKFITGMAFGAGIILWPWLVQNEAAKRFVLFSITAMFLSCCLSWIVGRPKSLKRVRELAGAVGIAIKTNVRRVPLVLSRCKSALSRLRQSDRKLRSAVDLMSSPMDGFPRRRVIYTAIGAIAILITAGALVLWPYTSALRELWPALTILAIGVIAGPWLLSRQHLPALAIASLACAIWLAGFGLGGDFSWYRVGFSYGMRRQQGMALGRGSNCNLAQLLGERWGWKLYDTVTTVHLPGMPQPTILDMRTLLAVIYGIALVMCAVAASSRARRNDPRILASLVAPWVLFHAVMSQMSGRYTMLGATISAALVGVAVGPSLLYIVLTGLSFAMISHQLVDSDRTFAPHWMKLVDGFYPDMAWMVVMVAAIVLFLAIAPRRHSASS